MNIRSIVLSAAATIAIVGITAASSLAMQPVPTNHLHTSAPINITSLAQPIGPGYSELGTLQAGRYALVTASGIKDAAGNVTAAAKTTLTFVSNDGAGNAISRRHLVQNGVPTLVDFGQVANPDNSGTLLVTFYANQKGSVSLDIWSPNL